MNEQINNPKHYMRGSIRPVDFIFQEGLNFNLGSAVKYICRWDMKGEWTDNLNKAIWYLQYEHDHHTPAKPIERNISMAKLNFWQNFIEDQKLPDLLGSALLDVCYYLQHHNARFLSDAMGCINKFISAKQGEESK